MHTTINQSIFIKGKTINTPLRIKNAHVCNSRERQLQNLNSDSDSQTLTANFVDI